MRCTEPIYRYCCSVSAYRCKHLLWSNLSRNTGRQNVPSSEACRPRRGQEEPSRACFARLRQPLLGGCQLPEVGWEGGRDHRRRERHRQGDGRGVRQERRQGRPRRRPGRPRPRRRRGARPRRSLLHALRRDPRGAGRRGRRPRRVPPWQAGRHVQQRRHQRLDDAHPARLPGSGRLRPRHGGQHAGHARGRQARRARHGASPRREHHLHGQHCGRAGRRGLSRIQRLQGGGAGPRARRGRGVGARRRARERRLAQLPPDAAGHGVHGPVLPRGEPRGAQAYRGEGHERDGRAGARGQGRGRRRTLPGVRRGQVRQRPQPRRRRRLHGREGSQYAGTMTLPGLQLLVMP